MNTTLLFQLLLAQVQVLAMTQGDKALDAAERKFTLPEKDVRALCRGMSEADQEEAVKLWWVVGDSLSDATVFTASRGRIQPD